MQRRLDDRGIRLGEQRRGQPGQPVALVAAGQGVALVPQLGVIGCPADVMLAPLPTRRRTRIAYRRGARRHPAVSVCIAAIRGSAASHLESPDLPRA